MDIAKIVSLVTAAFPNSEAAQKLQEAIRKGQQAIGGTNGSFGSVASKAAELGITPEVINAAHASLSGTPASKFISSLLGTTLMP